MIDHWTEQSKSIPSILSIHQNPKCDFGWSIFRKLLVLGQTDPGFIDLWMVTGHLRGSREVTLQFLFEMILFHHSHYFTSPSSYNYNYNILVERVITVMGKRGRGKRPNKVVLVSQGKGEVKRTQQTPFDPAGSNDVEYIVREIKAERVAKGGAAQWLIGWENFPDPKHDTWEPVENLAGHETTISDFRIRAQEEQEVREAAAAEKRKYKVKAREGIHPESMSYFIVRLSQIRAYENAF